MLWARNCQASYPILGQVLFTNGKSFFDVMGSFVQKDHQIIEVGSQEFVASSSSHKVKCANFFAYHFFLEKWSLINLLFPGTCKRVIGKQCRPRSDAT